MKNCGFTIREIVNFTLPLIFTSLIINLMFITDRVVLARYSIDSMNAVALGGNFLAIVTFAGINVAQIATVFVGQYNGMKEFSKVGYPVWQMIYFALAISMLFVPLSLFCHRFGLFPPAYESEGLNYLVPLLRCAGLGAMIAAFNSFFIGRGKSYMVILVTVMANILNAIFDVILVFGVKGIIPEMGARGAAYTTIATQCFSIIVMACIFLNEKHREKYNTWDWKFRPKLFWNCIKIGLPISISKIFSLLGWFLLLLLYNYASEDLATLETFALTVWMTFIFVADGCAKALSSMSANLIGRNDKDAVINLFNFFCKGQVILSIILAFPMIFFSEYFLELADYINGDFAYLHGEMSFLLESTWLILLTDGFLYLICGVLNAGGDTKFPMIMEISIFWIGVVLPTTILYYTGNLNSMRVVYTLIPLTQALNTAIIYYRYKKQNWFNKLI